ncbi:GrpB family protein [Paenibacillus dakarensis]|uniref:GrpB family protein n=1 Tax=Paenibacillus dakarensis TaxID=1527293 RepID=UPI0006D55EC6|nr:GrpB family protein [Paenibacillus dakarensis]
MEEVIVAEYHADWVKQFKEEKVKIAEALQDLEASIEHIGSTAVPGLGAKPVIDIMAGIKSLSDMDQKHMDRLMAKGYEYVHKPEFPERLFFRKGKWRAGTHHLHVYELDSVNWQNQLLFRDYLRDHAEILNNYYELKKELGAKYKNDRPSYTAGKEAFIQEVISRARENRKREHHAENE